MACEQAIRQSRLQWSILRLAAVTPIRLIGYSHDPGIMFEFSPDARFEFIHPADAGTAFARAVACEEAIGKILNIAGGEKCRMTHHEFCNDLMSAIGIGPLPTEAFVRTEVPRFFGDWLDTEESQRLLQYQKRGLSELKADMRKDLGAIVPLIRLLRPLVTWFFVRGSPYLAENRRTDSAAELAGNHILAPREDRCIPRRGVIHTRRPGPESAGGHDGSSRRGHRSGIGDGAGDRPAPGGAGRPRRRCSTCRAKRRCGPPRSCARREPPRSARRSTSPTARAVDAALDKVRAELGPVAIMVTSAGLDAFEPFTDITIESWERILAVNLTGTFHCLQAAVPDMLAARWGRIVTISSSSAQSGAPRMAHYVASKGGVIGTHARRSRSSSRRTGSRSTTSRRA